MKKLKYEYSTKCEILREKEAEDEKLVSCVGIQVNFLVYRKNTF